MIIHGTKTKQLKKRVSIEKVCSNCQNRNHTAAGFVKYNHIFWIPLVLTVKKVFLRCNTCKKTIDYDLLSENEKPDYPKVLFSLIRIWPYYAWIWIVVLFLTFGHFLL